MYFFSSFCNEGNPNQLLNLSSSDVGVICIETFKYTTPNKLIRDSYFNPLISSFIIASDTWGFGFGNKC